MSKNGLSDNAAWVLILFTFMAFCCFAGYMEDRKDEKKANKEIITITVKDGHADTVKTKTINHE